MKMMRIVPMLPVASMPASVAFYRKLGFEVEQRNDAWGWAMLRFDDCRLMLDQSIHGHGRWPRPTVIYLYPDDIDAFHAHATREGLALPMPEETFYGMRELRCEDPDGNRLWIGRMPADPA